MKRILLALTLFASIHQASAQKSSVEKNSIKLNPLSLFALTGNVAYERAINATQTVQLGVFYSALSAGDLKYSGVGVTPEYRFYLTGQALKGFYAAPFARYRRFNLTSKESANETTVSSVGGGAVMGWQSKSRGGFVFNIFAGPSYSKSTFTNESDEDTFDAKGGLTGFGIRSGIALGFAF